MARVVITGKIHPSGLSVFKSRSQIEVQVLSGTDEQEMQEAVRNADAILIRTSRLSRSAIESAKHLKVVARHGVGYDNIDLAALNERHIPLALVGNVNSISVAEHTLFLLLACMKNGITHDRAVRQGQWNVRDLLTARDVHGKTLLIVGFGRIGREVALRARSFGMRLACYDPWLDPARIEKEMAVYSDLATAVAEADAVSLHLPLTADTAKLFDRALISRMKRDAVLVCTARGGLMDELALAEALRSGTLKAAGLDVFESEPPFVDHPLFALDNVVLSPHSAALTEECAERMAVVSAQNCLDGIDGRLDATLLANPQVLGGK